MSGRRLETGLAGCGDRQCSEPGGSSAGSCNPPDAFPVQHLDTGRV